MTLAARSSVAHRLWNHRALRLLRDLSLEEMSDEELALIVALGFVLGLVPVPVCATLLCALAAVVLRLNGPAIQAVNYVVYPLQLALFAPFMRLGGWLFRAPAGTPPVIHGPAWCAVPGICVAAAHAVAGWLCVSVPVGLLVYCGAFQSARFFRLSFSRTSDSLDRASAAEGSFPSGACPR